MKSLPMNPEGGEVDDAQVQYGRLFIFVPIGQTPTEFKEKYTYIPWKEIAGMRDVLIHKYFGVDLDLTWEVVKKEKTYLN